MNLHILHKINSKWIKDLNIRHDTIKLLEGNIGKAFSDINHTDILLGQSLLGDRNKSKKKQMGHKLISFCTAKETISKTKR